MPLNLLALCGPPGEISVKRVRTSADVQNRLTGLFDGLEAQFRNGVEVERQYDSRWTPGPDELATIQQGAEVTAILARIAGGVLALPEIDGAHFDNEQIRALAVHRQNGGNHELLLQAFSSAQRLSRKFAVISNGNTFDKLEQSAFTLTNQIDVLVENDQIKFRSFHTAKKIFDLANYYREATDGEIREFSQHANLQVDADMLIELATQPIRKLISSVLSSGVLDRETAESIRAKAEGLVPVNIENDKVVLPLTRKEFKDLISFLDHKIYRSPVDNDPYETNSHRRRQG
jgi:hypothetical protein